MHYVIYGAGAIGGVIGARLFAAGHATTLIARGEHGSRIASRGLKVISPDSVDTVKVPTVDHPKHLQFDASTVVMMCMKSQHSLAALEDLTACAPLHTPIVCVQNGVANEAQAIRFFRRVYASVVILPASFLNPAEVITNAQGYGGILDTGCYPQGVDDTATRINLDLQSAGFSARADEQVMAQKHAKLLANLNNVLQAGLADFSTAAKPIQALVRKEALACYDAAGIVCASREAVRARRDGVFKMADVPGFARQGGSSWQSVVRGTGDIETEYLNGEVCRLGRLHNVPTPANDAAVMLGRELVKRRAGPGIWDTDQFMRVMESAF